MAVAVSVATAAYYVIENQAIKNEINTVRENIDSLNDNINEIITGLSNLSTQLSGVSSNLTTNFTNLGVVVENLSRELAEIKANFSELSYELGQLNEVIDSLKYPITLTDGLGRQVIIPYRPERVVSVAPSITEILFMIGAGDRVVGVDQFSNYPPEVVELVSNGTIEVVGGFTTINIEKILLLNPDVVFMTTGIQEDYALKLASMGVTVIVLPEGTLSDVFQSILTVGLVMDEFDNALTLIQDLRNRITRTYQKVQIWLNETGEEPVKVYYEVYPDYWTFGKDSFINDVIELAGGYNIFGDEELGYFVASPEAIIQENPDIILTTSMYGSFGPPEDLIARISSRPGWSDISAVVNGRIYVFTGSIEDILVRPGPRVVIAIEVLARILYPEAFGIASVPSVVDDEVITDWGISLELG
jgi:iron complex transport system substrate-binding protein